MTSTYNASFLADNIVTSFYDAKLFAENLFTPENPMTSLYNDFSLAEDNVTTLERDTSQGFYEATDVHVIMYSLIGSIGMLDNGFVILVILLSKSMRQKICNLLILNQSLVDFLGSLFLVTNSPLVANGKPPSNRIAGEIYCRIWANSYLLWSSFVVSTANLVAITIDRYVEIVFPVTYKVHVTRRGAFIAIALIWLVFLSLEFALFGYASELSDTGDHCILHQHYPSKAIKKLDGILVYVIIQVLPVVVMTYSYARMLRAMRQTRPAAISTISAAERVRHQRQERVRRNLIRTLVTVAVAYVLCITWNQTYFLLINLGVSLPFDSPFYHFSVYALFCNCIINPFIYTAQYREFQSSVRHMFSCLKRNPVQQVNGNSSASTAGTELRTK